MLALGGQWLWLALPAATVAAGAWFDAEYGLVTDLVDPSRGDGMGLVERALRWFPDRAGTVLAWYGELLVDPGSRWLVLLGLVAGAAVLPQRARKAFVVPWLLLVGALAAYMLVFVGTTNPLPWHLATAAPRTILHVTPLAALVLGLALGPRPTAHGLSSPG
ncbi:MAG: hypothetical protein KDE27_14665 [Planctomycetes bacterium]|nr:hypothetical protein [Planctomycetota bacterium]